MGGGIETLPPSILQEMLTGRLGAMDLARLEASSSLFRVPSGIQSWESKPITEAAAHGSCQMHPIFENFPHRARSELFARCNGNWKKVLHFLECLQRSAGHSTGADARNNVLAAAGSCLTLIVNGKGELYLSGEENILDAWPQYVVRCPEEIVRLIPLPPTTNRIVQISVGFRHAAFITETGQVFTFGRNAFCCCGVGAESDQEILEPTLVAALERIPCQQVTTGFNFTVTLTRTGEMYSWGCNDFGQLGHGNTRNEFRPRQIVVEVDDGTSDPVVQVSTGARHALAVTKSGRLFTWGNLRRLAADHNHNDIHNELRPKRVEHGGFAGLFIVCAAAGLEHSAAIDSSGQVYIWGHSTSGALGQGVLTDSCTPLLVSSLKDNRAVQVVADYSTFVLLDNGTVYYFGNYDLPTTPGSMDNSGSFTVEGHIVRSIACGSGHAVVVTTKGAIFGFGHNYLNQLGMVDPSAQEIPQEIGLENRFPIVTRATEVFSAVTGCEGAANMADGGELQWPAELQTKRSSRRSRSRRASYVPAMLF